MVLIGLHLVGSAVRGDYGENSDCDFCIESGKIRTLFVPSVFFRELRGAAGCEKMLKEIEEYQS